MNERSKRIEVIVVVVIIVIVVTEHIFETGDLMLSSCEARGRNLGTEAI